jgi:hypothetical protein
MSILKSIFGKKEGNSSCCNIQIQEVEKVESKEGSKEESCCTPKPKKNDSCCGSSDDKNDSCCG